MHSSTSSSDLELLDAPAAAPAADDSTFRPQPSRPRRHRAPQPSRRSPAADLDFTRVVPDHPWKSLLAATALLTLATTVAWELGARAHGYGPSLNDTPDLWAEQRTKVQPDSLVLIGTSRMLFNADLDVLEQAFGRRPIQLALAGSSPFPVLEDLARDESFRGTLIVDIVPGMFLAPPGSPPMAVAQKALRRRDEWNYSQKWSHRLGMLLEERLAFLKQEDLTLKQLLARVPIPDRPGALVAPKLPPYFYTVDRDRRARMFAEAAVIGSPLQQEVALGWLPLFTLPPPPSFIPPEQFGAMMGRAVEQRFADTRRHIQTLRARGVKVVFVRMPVQGPLVDKEEAIVPVAAGWGRLVQENGVPAINFADHPELDAFILPEWSHLSAPDSVEFTKRLVPHLQRALGQPNPAATAHSVPPALTSG
jgi:hypothetical protein